MGQPPLPSRRRRYPSEDRDPILDALDRLGIQITAMDAKFTAQMASMEAKFGTLSETYVPRREINESVSGIRERQSEFHSRLTAMEEWRLSETQRAAQVQLTLTQQTTTAQITNQSQVARSRSESDSRLINSLWGLLSGGGIVLLGYILTHLPH